MKTCFHFQTINKYESFNTLILFYRSKTEQNLFNSVLKGFASFELRNGSGRDFDFSAGSRINAHAGRPLGNVESTKTG